MWICFPASVRGGFALAASWCWPDHKVVAFCEIDKFCQQVLSKHWPDTPIIPDVRDVNYAYPAIDLLTAGVPCQPASTAGKRQGTADDRWLWPQTFRVIRELKPTWCLLENVRGLLTLESGVVFENLLLELEAIGYEVQAYLIPACAVGAPHRRDRVWIVAHATGNGSGRTAGEICKADGRPGRTLHIGTVDADRHAADTTDNRLHDIGAERGIQPGTFNWECVGKTCWDEPWLEAATRLCSIHDGVSRGLVRQLDGTTITRSKHRVESLKAYGNAIVPAVALKIMEAIKYTDENLR